MAQVSTRSLPTPSVAVASTTATAASTENMDGATFTSLFAPVLADLSNLQSLQPQPASQSEVASSSGIQLNSASENAASPVMADASQSQSNNINTNRDTSNTDVANTKEKTPMCLINELARFNKIQHQYHLTDEDGPAHNKTFTVLLRLGEEEYRSSGTSIKRAQQTAAGNALEKTAYKQRPPRSGKNISRFVGNLTPTVELNALAMKRGQPAIYSVLDQSRNNSSYSPPNFNFRGAYNQRYHYPRYPRPCYVSLRVGSHAFVGEGSTVQIARHNAAEKALRVLQDLPTPPSTQSNANDDNSDKNKENEESVATNGIDGSRMTAEEAKISGGPIKIHNDDCGDGGDDELKSPISLVHEVALKRNLRVDFQVTRESGPPHMRTFLTKCLVGDMVTEGEGNAKKLSKKRAAEKMLDELKKLPALPPPVATTLKRKKNPVKKKTRNLIKEQKANPEYGQGINPISRLIQIQQAKREKEPVYSLVTEGGLPRRREFVMRVQVGSQSCNGNGPNKKLAKRAAAEALLQTMGYSRPVTSTAADFPGSSSIANKSSGPPGGADVSNISLADRIGVIGDRGDGEGRSGRQLVPGLLLMPETTPPNSSGACMPNSQQHQNASQQVGELLSIQDARMIAIARELLVSGLSPTAEAITKSGHNEITGQRFRNPKHQLAYLANVLDLTVTYTDFPRGNKREYLSLVSLSTNPPQVSHGSGETLEASHYKAARTALRALAEYDLDSNLNTFLKKDQPASGDGLHAGPAQNGTAKLADCQDPS